MPQKKKLSPLPAPDWEMVFQAGQNPAMILDADSRILHANLATQQITGLTEKALRGRACYEIFHNSATPPAGCPLQKLLASAQNEIADMEVQALNHWFRVSCSLLPAAPGSAPTILHVATDITERIEAVKALQRANRLYATLSQVNQAIVHLRGGREALLKHICQVAVEFGGFELAWFGLLDEASGEIHPAAWAGNEDGYLENIRINIHPESGLHTGPSGQALINRQIIICADITSDPRYAPWREAALQRNYHASAAAPIYTRGKLLGALNLYAKETGFFGETEQKLLREIAEDISFALDVLAEREAQAEAENALRESEERFRSLYENSTVGIYRTTPAGQILLANPAALTMLGFDNFEELATRNLNQGGYESPAARAEFIERMTRDGLVAGLESVWKRKDGSRLSVRESARAIHDADANILFYDGVVEDISARQQAEERLRRSEILLAEAQAVGKLGHVEWVSASDELICSQEFLRIFELPPQMRVDRQVLRERLHPDDLERLRQADRQAFANRADIDYEYRLLLPGGGMRWVRQQSKVDYDENGQPTRMIGVFQDISARKQAEERLAESEASYRGLFNGIGEAIYVQDRQGVFLDVNASAEKMYGYPRETLIGKTPAFVAAPGKNDLAEVGRSFQRALAGEPQRFEFWGKRANGEIFPKEVRLVRGSYFGQEVVIASADDISARKQAETSLRQRADELEMLHQSGLMLNRLLTPTEVAQEIVSLVEKILGWQHAAVRIYQPEQDTLELLAFNQPKGGTEESHRAAEALSRQLVAHPGQGLSGWAFAHRQSVRSGDVSRDPRFAPTFPGLNSGLYVPLLAGQHAIGVISIESEAPNAFSEANEHLLTTLATQAAIALENARLLADSNQRVDELETINRVSTLTRSVLKPEDLLEITLKEILATLRLETGSFHLIDESNGTLDKVLARGWLTEIHETPQPPSEGIFGYVFNSGKFHVTQEFISDPLARPEAVQKIPSGWGGICVPISSPQGMLGVLLVAAPSERIFNPNEIRLLETLAEMTGSSLRRLRLSAETTRYINRLQALHEIDRAIASSFDLRPSLQTLLNQVRRQLNVEAADILLFEPALQTLEYQAGQGFYGTAIQTTRIRLGEGAAGRAALENRVEYLADLNEASAHFTRAAQLAGERFISYCAVPLVSKGEIRGVLEVFLRRKLAAAPEWINFLETLAGQAALAIDNARLFADLKRSNLDLSLAYNATIEGWSRALELRDEDTEGHTLRVTELTLRLAKAYGLSGACLIHLRHGALLHDIGKIGVPDLLLRKPGPLTPSERAIMETHVQLAYDMLSPIEYLRPAMDIPYCHHEKWDGSGYPRGLKGEEIPLAARLFAVVDVFDALTSTRPYRPAWNRAKVLGYLRENSGSHFDPQILDVFLKIMNDQ